MESTEIKIVREINKLSGCLVNIDNLNSLAKQKKNKIFFGKMMRDINKFDDFFVRHTKFLASAMEKSDSQTYSYIVHECYESLDDVVEASTEEKAQLGLLFSKLLSAKRGLESLKGLDISQSYLVDPLVEWLDVVVKRSYLRKINIDMNDLEFLVKRIDKIGENFILAA